MVLSYPMKKEKNNVLLKLGVITRKDVMYQYKQWCHFQSSYEKQYEPMNEELLDIITEEELQLALEVTNSAFDSDVLKLQDAFITSLLTLITETKKGN